MFSLCFSWNDNSLRPSLFVHFYGSFHFFNLNLFWLSARRGSTTSLRRNQTSWRLTLQPNCAGHSSNMEFEGISSWLLLVEELFFAFSPVRGMTFRAVRREGEPSELIKAAAPVKEVQPVVVTGVCAILPPSLLLTHTYYFYIYTKHWGLQLLL